MRTERVNLDAPGLADLFLALWRELDEMYGPNPGTEFRPEQMDAAGTEVFVVYDGDDAIGCAAIQPWERDSALEVKRMYVRPEARGTPAATRLLEALADAAIARGVHELRLETGTRQERAIAFYRREGFEPCDCWGSYATDPLSRCFVKRLAVTKRFDGRAGDYDRARPRYPDAAVEHVRRVADVAPGDTIVDLGAGTGLLAMGFVDRGDDVVLVEPSEDMARTAETRFGDRARVVRATAEATTLDAGSAKLAIAGQAFHWFDAAATKVELARILTRDGVVAIVWNQRRLDGTPFLEAYERFLHEWGTDYAKVALTYENADDLAAIFGAVPAPVRFENAQVLDEAGLRARIHSCSYIPGPGHARYDEMVEAIGGLFAAHQENGAVTLLYDTTIYAGPLATTSSQP